jgi:hypothetical protein
MLSSVFLNDGSHEHLESSTAVTLVLNLGKHSATLVLSICSQKADVNISKGSVLFATSLRQNFMQKHICLNLLFSRYADTVRGKTNTIIGATALIQSRNESADSTLSTASSESSC